MASLLQRALRILGRAASDAVDDELRRRSSSSRRSSRQGGSARSGSRRASSARSRSTPRPASAQTPAPEGTEVDVWDVPTRGLPTFAYVPDPDGDADPGEVVWTWVPYEEDARQGKDRPVLVLARVGGRLVVAQMTSKDHDHDAAQEARWGRYWHDVGTGAWDPRGRPSEVRLDRLLQVSPDHVRREGATMDRDVFDGVVAALREHWA